MSDFDDFDELDFDNLDLDGDLGGNNDDDEDVDLAEIEQANKVDESKPSAAQLAAAEKKRKADNAALAAKIREEELANETPEQRKLREKAEIEAAQIDSVGDMFDDMEDGPRNNSKSTSEGIFSMGSTKLANKSDHEKFARALATKLESSTPIHVATVYDVLNLKLLSKLDLNALESMLELVTKFRNDKKKLAAKDKSLAQKKKDAKVKKFKDKQHDDLFGGDFSAGKYEEYEQEEDFYGF